MTLLSSRHPTRLTPVPLLYFPFLLNIILYSFLADTSPIQFTGIHCRLMVQDLLHRCVYSSAHLSSSPCSLWPPALFHLWNGGTALTRRSDPVSAPATFLPLRVKPSSSTPHSESSWPAFVSQPLSPLSSPSLSSAPGHWFLLLLRSTRQFPAWMPMGLNFVHSNPAQIC